MSDAPSVKSIITPTRLEYEFRVGGAHAEFLASLAEGRRHDARIPGVERFGLAAFRKRVGELIDHVLPEKPGSAR